MSWLRSAVSKAVEVGGNNNLTRTVKSYAENVTHAVAEGAKILQDRMVKFPPFFVCLSVCLIYSKHCGFGVR